MFPTNEYEEILCEYCEGCSPLTCKNWTICKPRSDATSTDPKPNNKFPNQHNSKPPGPNRSYKQDSIAEPQMDTENLSTKTTTVTSRVKPEATPRKTTRGKTHLRPKTG